MIVEFAGLGIGLFDQTLILHQFHNLVSSKVKSLIAGKNLAAPNPIEMAQSQKIVGMVKAVSDSDDGNMTLAYQKEGNDGERESLIVTKQDAQAILRNFGAASSQQVLLTSPAEDFSKPRRALMRLYQHNQDPKVADKKRTQHKATIADFSSSPRPLTYETHDIAAELSEIVAREPYGETIFDVEALAITEGDKIKAYRLIQIHEWFRDPDLLEGLEP